MAGAAKEIIGRSDACEAGAVSCFWRARRGGERLECRPAYFPHILALTSSMRRGVPVLANPLRHLRRGDRPVRRSAFVSLRYCLMSSYSNSHHARLEGYDYTADGFHFVTLCIQDRLPLLGRVNGGEMQLFLPVSLWSSVMRAGNGPMPR